MGTRVDHEGKLLEVEAKGIEYPIQRTPARFMDLIGNHKVAQFENIYDADFEYSEQSLRWERLVFFSTPTSPIVLTGANFVAMSTLGSASSFAQRDVSATAFTGGERVKKFPLPAGGSGIEPVDLSDLFPLYNNIQGTVPDIITLAITTQGGTPTNAGGDFDAQEAMS